MQSAQASLVSLQYFCKIVTSKTIPLQPLQAGTMNYDNTLHSHPRDKQ